MIVCISTAPSLQRVNDIVVLLCSRAWEKGQNGDGLSTSSTKLCIGSFLDQDRESEPDYNPAEGRQTWKNQSVNVDVTLLLFLFIIFSYVFQQEWNSVFFVTSKEDLCLLVIDKTGSCSIKLIVKPVA